MITSLQNPRVKDAVRLRDRRHREKQGRILIDGGRELARAMAAGVRLREVFVCEPLCRSDESQRLLAALPGSGAEILDVAEPVFEKLAFGQRAEGVLGVAEMPAAARSTDLALPDDPLVAVLEGVEKPGNVGACSAAPTAPACPPWSWPTPRTDLYNPNAIRASLGTIFTLPVCAAAAAERSRGCGARLGDPGRAGRWLRAYTEVDYRGPTAIVLGSEAEGLSPLWSAADVTAVRLPMLGAADSLNVSAAAAVLF